MKRFPFKRVAVVILLGGVVAGVGALAFVPIMRPPPKSPAIPPAPTYAEAVAAIERIIAATPESVGPAGRPILLTHGHASNRAFVLLHGLSNAPAQFEAFGRILYDRGHNVYIPRLPYHGEADRMTTAWQNLTAQQMVDFGNEAADLARGLGREVVVAGLSINGTTVAWMAQNRSDLRRCVLMAPFLAPAGMPDWAVAPTYRLLLRMPNFFLWWDPAKKENLGGPPYAYPRFPTRVIGETMWLGGVTTAGARISAPKSPDILVITTASDTAINNTLVDGLVKTWTRRGAARVDSYTFPIGQDVPHDFIDPNQPNQKTELVYPKLVELFEAD